MRTRLMMALLAAAAGGCSGTGPFSQDSAEQGAVKIAFGSGGLASLRYGGVELLKDGTFKLRDAQLVDWEGDAVPPPDRQTSRTADPRTNTAMLDCWWGRARCVYTARGNRLDMTVTVTNRTQAVLNLALLQLLELQFPRAIKGYELGLRKGHNREAPTVVTIDFDDGVMSLVNDDVGRGLYLGVARREGEKKATKTDFIPDQSKMGYQATDTYPIIVANARTDAFYNKWLNDPHIRRPIYPGATDTFHVSLRFGRPGADPGSLAGDVYRKFAQAYPRTFKWDDRRPIGMLFFGGQSLAKEDNPRGWSGALRPKADINTPQGREEFKKKLLGLADRVVANLKAMNCQGVIVWDLEGYGSPGATYVGDPRSLPPEIEAAADEFFKKFTDADLRVGCTLRPQFPGRPCYADTGHTRQVQVFEPSFILHQKVAYAKKRWGCTLFYVDSNSKFDPYGRYNDEGSYELMSATVFEKVARMHPDVLLMPEHENERYYAYTAPYNELRQGYTGTPANIRRIYPDAFCILRLADGPVKARWKELVASIRRGDVMIIHADSVSRELLQLYKEAQGAAAD